MKITDVTATEIVWPSGDDLKKYAPTGDWKFPPLYSNLIQVHTDEGIVGLGETYPVGVTPLTSVIVKTALKPILVGENPFDVDRLWEKMYAATWGYGRKGLPIIAMSGIDLALWDIIGKAKKQSLTELLGGRHREKIRAYASFPPWGRDPVKDVMKYIEQGFTAAKIKVWSVDDIKYIKSLRDAAGSDVDIMADGNCFHSRRSAKLVVKACEKYDAYWFEEPYPPEDLKGMAELSASTNVLIAAGENEYTRWGFRDMIESRAVDVLMPDAIRSGGVSECIKIADQAEVYDIPCDIHIFELIGIGMAASLQLCAAIKNTLFGETYTAGYGIQKLFLKEPFEVKKGYYEVSKKPGLGVELDQKAMERYMVK